MQPRQGHTARRVISPITDLAAPAEGSYPRGSAWSTSWPKPDSRSDHRSDSLRRNLRTIGRNVSGDAGFQPSWLTATPARLDSEAVRAGCRRQDPPAHRRDRQPRQRHHCRRGEGTIDEGLACSPHPGSPTPAKQGAPLLVTIESLERPITAVGHTSAGEPQKCHRPDRTRAPTAGKPGSARPTPQGPPQNPHRLGQRLKRAQLASPETWLLRVPLRPQRTSMPQRFALRAPWYGGRVKSGSRCSGPLVLLGGRCLSFRAGCRA